MWKQILEILNLLFIVLGDESKKGISALIGVPMYREREEL